MFMRYHGGAVSHQCGSLGHPQAPSMVTPELITELSGKAYDNNVDDDPGMGDSAVVDNQESDDKREDPEDEDTDKREAELAGEDNDDDDALVIH